MANKKEFEAVQEDRDEILDQHIAKLQDLKAKGEDLENPVELNTSLRRGNLGVTVTTTIAIGEVTNRAY